MFIKKEKLSSFLIPAWEILKVVILAALVVIPIRYFLFQPFVVRGSSMEPVLYSGDYLIVDQISYRFQDPERGEVVIFDYPLDRSQRFVKRIIGLPNEKIKIIDNKVKIEKEEVLREEYIFSKEYSQEKELFFSLNEEEYLVLGDNRGFSSDSREWGPIKRDHIVGRVFIRLFPFNKISTIKNPGY